MRQPLDAGRAVHHAADWGDNRWQGLPVAPMWGEPIGAVATVPGKPGAPEQITVDRYRALPYPEVWSPITTSVEPTEHTYYLPDTYLRTPDAMDSKLVLMNPGLTCAQVTVSAFRTGGARLREEIAVVVPPGASLRLTPSATWPGPGTAALRVTSNLPLASALL